MLDQLDQVHRVNVGGREFAIQRHLRRRGVVEVVDSGVVVLRVVCSPDAPLSGVEATLQEFIVDEALPTPEEAKSWGPAEEEIWRPSTGRKLPNGSIEIAVTATFLNVVTDHGVHLCADRSWWTETGEEIGLLEGSDDDHQIVADQVICFIGDELIEGQRYELLLNVSGPYSSGQSSTHFVYSQRLWPPIE